MGKWNGCVEFNAMLNNTKWNSLEISIIPCKNVLILLEQCLCAGDNCFIQCCIYIYHLKLVDSSQIEESYLNTSSNV